MILKPRAPSADKLTVGTSPRWKRRAVSRLERRARVATLREDVSRGRYRVSAEDVAKSLLGRLGIAWIHGPEATLQQR